MKEKCKNCERLPGAVIKAKEEGMKLERTSFMSGELEEIIRTQYKEELLWKINTLAVVKANVYALNSGGMTKDKCIDNIVVHISSLLKSEIRKAEERGYTKCKVETLEKSLEVFGNYDDGDFKYDVKPGSPKEVYNEAITDAVEALPLESKNEDRMFSMAWDACRKVTIESLEALKK